MYSVIAATGIESVLRKKFFSRICKDNYNFLWKSRITQNYEKKDKKKKKKKKKEKEKKNVRRLRLDQFRVPGHVDGEWEGLA